MHSGASWEPLGRAVGGSGQPLGRDLGEFGEGLGASFDFLEALKAFFHCCWSFLLFFGVFGQNYVFSNVFCVFCSFF